MIPKKQRERMSKNPFYKKCCLASFRCGGRIEWHHHFQYAGRKIQDEWAIVPVCKDHHDVVRNKKIAEKVDFICFSRLFENPKWLKEAEKKYPKAIKSWEQKYKYLNCSLQVA